MTWYELLKQGIRDNYNNRMYIEGGSIYMNLYKLGEARLIARLKGKDLIMIRTARHLMKVNNSYGFNYELINILADDVVIYIGATKSNLKYFITVKEIKEKGSFLHFLSAGFEKQIFVPLENLHKNQQEKK